MLDALKELVTYTVPWWTWTVPSAAAGVVIFVTVSRSIGWRNAALVTLGYAMFIITALAQSRGRQEGWKDRIKQENRHAETLVSRANAARERTRRDNGTRERLYRDDGFKRGS